LQNKSNKSLARLLPALHFLRPYLGRIFLAMIALLFTAAVMLSIGQGVRLLIDQGFTTGSPEQLKKSLLGFGVLVVALASGTFMRFYLVTWIGERVITDIRRAVFDHVVDLHPAFFETNLSGEIQGRITTDTTLLQTVIGSSVSIALRNIIMFFGGIILLFITNAKLTGIVLLVVPLTIGPIMFFGRLVRRLSRSSQDKVANVGTYVGETLQNIKTVQAFNHQEYDKEMFANHAEGAFDVAVKRIRYRAILITVVMVLLMGSIGGMLWVGGTDVMAGDITTGELAAFGFYAMLVAVSVAVISEVYGELQRAAGATERLMELLQAESVIFDNGNMHFQMTDVKGVLKLNQLGFHYESRPDHQALDDISLTIPSGGHIAIVGPSGAGKSTLFDLILRFYDPQNGSIELDGIEIRDIPLKELRENIGIVPQSPALFTTTVSENIRYGRPDASEEEVKAAAKAAYADEFIERLPDGYDSFVGESGVRLSGGQRQRIAIARAVLKNPRVLLLDEATSALDAESEHVVQKALTQLMKNRTTLVIAHRLATVVHADKIIVLDNGKIVGSGTHRALIQSNALYARLAKLQFSDADKFAKFGGDSFHEIESKTV